MAVKPRKKSILFRTTAGTDVQYSGGYVTVAGLERVSRKDITSVKQIKSRAEVAQVVTVTTGTSLVPTAQTTYKVAVYDPLRVQAGYQEEPKVYKYTTPADITSLGATAALQREAINGELITKINDDATNHAVAATLGTGTGFTVTDDGSYYPVYAQNMSNIKGVNSVYTIQNNDGSGFVGTEAAVTTTAVYAFGVGANLLSEKPVIDFVTGGLVSGVLGDAPLTIAGLAAVSGQNYDGFVIESMYQVDAIQATGQYAYIERIDRIFADNGTGSDTANLAGFKAFERKMHKLIVSTYGQDPCTVQEWFDKPIVFQDPLGAAPTGTANTLGWQLSPYGSLNRTNIGTQTIVAPVLDANGLLIDQDDTAGDGSHTSANQQALGDQSFVVGKTAFMVAARVVAADWTDTQFLVGFRKKAVYTADYNDYTDLAAIGGGSADGDSIYTFGILNNAATVATDTSVNFADTVSIVLMIKVAIDGTVTAYANGVSYPIYSAGTTTLVLDADDEMIPFYQHVNIGNGDPAVSIGEFFAVANTDAIVTAK